MRCSQALVLAFLGLTTLSGCFSREQTVLNKTALVVNGREISTQEFADRLAVRLRGFDALYAKDETNLNRAKEETIQSFVIESIARDYAKKHGIKVDKNEIEEKISEIRSQYPDDFAFRRAMAKENMSLERWREDIEFTILQKKIFNAVSADVEEPTEADMKKYYEANKKEFHRPARVKLRQIVLEKEDDAKRILDELNRGKSMEDLARKFSIAPEAADGGNTGWIEKGTLEVFDQAFKMSVGARSKILKSPYGWHIFQVLDKEPEARLSFQEAKAKIRKRLTEARAQQVFSTWLEEQVRKSSIKRDDAVLSSITVTTRGS